MYKKKYNKLKFFWFSALEHRHLTLENNYRKFECFAMTRHCTINVLRMLMPLVTFR